MAICQHKLVFLDTDGKQLASLSLQDEKLTDYSVSADGWAILLLEPTLGSNSQILTVSADGKLLGKQKLTDRVRTVSACEGYAAVLTELYVQTYDRKLRAYDRSWAIQGLNRAIARADGTVLLVGNASTKLYIP